MTLLALLNGDLRTAIIAAVVAIGVACLWAVDRHLSRPVEWHLDDRDHDYSREEVRPQ